MWTRLYLLLVVVRLYFAFQPSYIHPDEHFQGPEVIAGEVFGWPAHKTWEFTTSTPIRSVFPLWLVYGFPLTILKWIWEGLGYGDVPPIAAFYALRALMFVLSFVLEDGAIHELVSLRRDRSIAITLVASSYVTWTFQTHTFSNSLETLLMLWCIILMRRIRQHDESTMASTCAAVAFLGVLGTFNRITFPAFLVIPAAQLLPHLFKRTLRIPVIFLTALLTLAIAITTDTEYYTGNRPHIRELRGGVGGGAVFTPLNNLLYNFDTSNLAQHGLHPFWQHFTANLPQLIGPALPLLIFSCNQNALFWTSIMGIVILSCFRHQEPRFLLPAVPTLISSISIPRRAAKVWITSWILFNIAAGVLFGIYHQGGVIPAQNWLHEQQQQSQQQSGQMTNVFWWKTYSPPRWLLNGSNAQINTTDLMGTPGEEMLAHVTLATKKPSVFSASSSLSIKDSRTLLVAPASATFLDALTVPTGRNGCRKLQELWRYRRHIGLDDLDFGDDGVWPTLRRVVGRRGLVIWRVNKECL